MAALAPEKLNAAPAEGICLACKAAPIEYESSVCHHPLFCKKCAMKCATGGRCKVCHAMFPDLRRLAPPPPPSASLAAQAPAPGGGAAAAPPKVASSDDDGDSDTASDTGGPAIAVPSTGAAAAAPPAR